MNEEIVDLSRIKIFGFEWDNGNKAKNWTRHQVTTEESEEVFYNEPQKIFKDYKHSEKEERLVCYGITDKSRRLTVVFTLRNDRLRIISARDQTKNERKIYEQKN